MEAAETLVQWPLRDTKTHVLSRHRQPPLPSHRPAALVTREAGPERAVIEEFLAVQRSDYEDIGTADTLPS